MRVLDERREALVEREIDLCPRGRAEDPRHRESVVDSDAGSFRGGEDG